MSIRDPNWREFVIGGAEVADKLKFDMNNCDGIIEDYQRKIKYWTDRKESTRRKLYALENGKKVSLTAAQARHNYCELCHVRVYGGYYDYKHYKKYHPKLNVYSSADNHIVTKYEYPCTCKRKRV